MKKGLTLSRISPLYPPKKQHPKISGPVYYNYLRGFLMFALKVCEKLGFPLKKITKLSNMWYAVNRSANVLLHFKITKLSNLKLHSKARTAVRLFLLIISHFTKIFNYFTQIVGNNNCTFHRQKISLF